MFRPDQRLAHSPSESLNHLLASHDFTTKSRTKAGWQEPSLGKYNTHQKKNKSRQIRTKSGQAKQIPPEELCRSPSKAHHVVRDGTKQQRLYQVIGQLNEALSQGERKLVVHAAGTLSVHDATLCEGHRLDSHGVDDAQEKHGQVEATQDVAQVLSRLPAKEQHTVRNWWFV